MTNSTVRRSATLLLATATFVLFTLCSGTAFGTANLDQSSDMVPFSNAPSQRPQFAPASIPNPSSGIGDKHILVYRVDFSDAVGAAIASNTAAVLLSDLSNYYRDMSYGLMNILPAESGSVITDTLRLPEPSTSYDNNFVKLINDVRDVAANNGYAPSQFDFDVIFTGAKPFLVFGALSYVGGPGIWVGNGNFNVGVVGHELGHNLGLPHASAWNTGDQSSIGPGAKEEYGDPFDSMGTPGGSTSHFNARFKNFIHWIPDSDAPFISQNGTYRIAAHDHQLATGLRALRITRSPTLNYWIEFRQTFNNHFVTNGAGLRWAGNDATNTLLIDTTPGTSNLKNDSAILIGRTFTDPCIDLHITPIGKGGTTPESLDVVVNRGPFPGNLPPTVSVSASATTVPSGTAVTFQATASDPNGDALAYYWDFGDNTFGGNQPTITNTWARDGEYVARCTVTDMKGGTASASITIRVGAVTTFLIDGHVRDSSGAPVEGALVKSGARFTYSNSDGSYRLSRLPAGRQTMVGVLDGFSLYNAGFENPVTVGPNASGADFVALGSSLNSITLVATGSVWKYLDTGTAPVGYWTSLSFDDSAWNSGRGKFGYGVGDEATVISYGPNPSARYITTWFRRPFVIDDTSSIDHLIFRLRRDDGAVVYLNGNELYRENMPAGPVQPSTTAVADVGSTEEATFFKRTVPPTELHSGTNLLAVEIHQFATNSTDLSFDLELTGLTESSQALLPRLAAQRSGSSVLLSWPAAYSGWSLYTEPALTGAWTKSSAPLLLTNDLNTVSQSPSNPAAFFQLHKPTFCSPFE